MGKQPERINIVIHHYPCPDGVFSILPAHIFFQKFEPQIPVIYIGREPMNPILWSDLENIIKSYAPAQPKVNLHVSDFPINLPVIEEIDKSPLFEKVTILDHHQTMSEILEKAQEKNLLKKFEIHMDLNRSAATVALDYYESQSMNLSQSSLFSKLANSDPQKLSELQNKFQKIYKFVEDRDLFRFQLKDTQHFTTGFYDLNLELDPNKNPKIFDFLLHEIDPEDLVKKGAKIQKQRDELIDSCVAQKKVFLMGGDHCELLKSLSAQPDDESRQKIFGGKCYGVYLSTAPHIRSDLGNKLAAASKADGYLGIGLVYYDVPDNIDLLKISVRALASEDFDSSKLSETFGGGGHRCANSFTLKRSEFLSWILEN